MQPALPRPRLRPQPALLTGALTTSSSAATATQHRHRQHHRVIVMALFRWPFGFVYACAITVASSSLSKSKRLAFWLCWGLLLLLFHTYCCVTTPADVGGLGLSCRHQAGCTSSSFFFIPLLPLLSLLPDPNNNVRCGGCSARI
jgi:hypothetical protein